MASTLVPDVLTSTTLSGRSGNLLRKVLCSLRDLFLSSSNSTDDWSQPHALVTLRVQVLTRERSQGLLGIIRGAVSSWRPSGSAQ
jgi:hypothetical protein